jgi:L-cysteine:1D-myo-inositol 2-amino-2-deoxy-alpha-D-glucopyranoside ligase
MAVRLAIIGNHYSQDWEWTDQLLSAAEERLNLWRDALAMQGGADAHQVLQQIRISLAQNLDTPSALRAVDDWASSTLAGANSDPTAQGLVARTLDALLGIAL